MKSISIYVHIPFCVRKCVYCDFASFSGMESKWKLYIDAVRSEIERRKEMLHDRKVCSVFFGGGTPSIISAEYIAAVLSDLRSVSCFLPDAEITIEANPGTVTPEKLETYRRAGINRISFGVQSFDAQLLRSLGRIHTPQQAKDAVLMARECGFDNISIDLMYALPGQTMEHWRDTLQAAVSLPVTHISAYSLILEDDTEMKRRADAGEVCLPDEDTVIEMQRTATAVLRDHGFERYEISNYAKHGRRSRHNTVYWTDGDYLGIGSAAHSLVDDVRFSNPADVNEYLNGGTETDKARRTPHDHMEEIIMLSTRMTDGLDIAKWKQLFGTDFETVFDRQLRQLKRYRLADIRDGHLALTEKGMELQDNVVLTLLEAL